MLKFSLFILFLGFSIGLLAQNGTEAVKLSDMLKVKSVNNLSLSPDGSKALIGIQTIEPDTENKGEYKYISQLWLMPSDGSSSPHQLTTRENASQAAWSPDGKQIVFVRVAEGKPQLFLLSLEGGEPRQLTRSRYGATAPKWSPDGRQILFSGSISFRDLLKDSVLNPGKQAPEWASEKPGLSNDKAVFSTAKADPDGNIEEARAWLDNNVIDRKAKVLNKLNFQDEMDVSADMGFSHFFIVGLQPDAKPVALTKGFFRINGADFTPDGKQIIFTGAIDSVQHPDRILESSIYLMNIAGGQITTLLSAKGRSFSSPKLSNSGQWLAFQHSTTSFVTVPTLAIMPLKGNLSSAVDIPFDRNKGGFVWSADDKYIYFSSQSNGGAPLYKADIKTRKVDQLTDYNSGITNFDLIGNRLVYAKTEVSSPSELYTADANAKTPKRISELNTGWLQGKKLSFPEKQTFVNDKGMTVEYWVMKPYNYEPGKKYPLLLEIHGGPSAMWGPGETSMWHEYQYFCGKGYGIVYCNPRGSGGYGETFLRGNISDWGKGPTSDVLTALDKAVALGWADTSKLLVTGGSYAGYLVAWIVGHDNRFKAACAQRGVYDLATFFGEGNAWRLVPNYFGGYPWEDSVKTILERESPINYVQNVQTPLIIFHGENDRRTGFVQSEMLYRSLKVLNRPVEYVRHPGGTHELTRSGNNRQRMDQMLRTWEFFERWINTGK